MNVILRIPEKHWLNIQDAAEKFAETFPVNTKPRSAIFKSLLRVRHIQPRVKIEVLGGVAEVTRCTPGVTVTIQDHDNEKAG